MATLSVKSRAVCLEALVRSSRCAVSLLSNIRCRMFSGSDVEEEKSSHFGFQAVSEKDKTQKGAYTCQFHAPMQPPNQHHSVMARFCKKGCRKK